MYVQMDMADRPLVLAIPRKKAARTKLRYTWVALDQQRPQTDLDRAKQRLAKLRRV